VIEMGGGLIAVGEWEGQAGSAVERARVYFGEAEEEEVFESPHGEVSSFELGAFRHGG